MNARSIALIVAFAAVAIALNVVRVPVLYLPGLSYTAIEIPVVAAFLLFGFKIGVLVEVLHVMGQLVLFPAGPEGFVVYPMGSVAVLLMFVGMFVAKKFLTHKTGLEETLHVKRSTLYLTAFATLFRGGLMPLIDYGLLYHVLLPIVLRFSIPEAYIAGLIPGFILYNVTVALYTIPIAYIIAARVRKYLQAKSFS